MGLDMSDAQCFEAVSQRFEAEISVRASGNEHANIIKIFGSSGK